MFKRILIFAGIFACSVFAQGVSAATVDSTLHFRSIKRTDHLEFVWKRYTHPSLFASYFIVRSEPGGPKAVDAGDVVAITTNRYSTNGEDRPPHAGTFFYRLCITRKDATVICSKVVKVASTSVAASPRPTPVVTPALVDVTPVATSTDPTPIITAAPAGELVLSSSPSASGTVLSWTPARSLVLAQTFARYVLVRSFEDPTPAYPTDGYLAKLQNSTQTFFTDSVYVDPALLHAPRWYRVCAVDAANTIQCGPVAASTP